MTSPLMGVRDLSYTYPNGHRALDGLCFTVFQGEALGIIGPNGAGKSTLLQLLIGLFPLKEGLILVDGLPLNRKNLPQIREKMGLLFQNPDDQLFCPTVRADVSFGPSNRDLHPEEVKELADHALDAAGITHLADRSPSSLSVGEKKAAALASILSMKPEILLMDETSAHLDPLSRRRLIRIVSHLPETKILVSHDLDFIWETCDRVLLLHGGRMVAEGLTERILSDKTLLEQYDMELPLRLQACPRCGREAPSKVC